MFVELLKLGLPKDRGFLLGNALAILEAISGVALLGCSAWLISAAAEQPPIMYLNMVIVGVRGFALGRAFFRYTQRLTLHDSAFKLQTLLRPSLIRAVSPMAPAGLAGISRGDLGSQLIGDVEEVQNLGVRVIAPTLQALVSAVLTVVALAAITGANALILAVALAGACVVALPISSLWNRKQVSSAQDSRELLQSKTQVALENLELAKAYQWDESIFQELAEADERLAGSNRRFALTAGFGASIFSLFSTLSVVAIAAYSANEVMSGTLDRRMLAVATLVPLAVFELAAQFQPALFGLQRYLASATRLLATLLAKPGTEIAPATGSVELGKVRSLSLSDAHFRYGPAGSLIGPFNLTLNQGDALVITGPSGAGKSTLAFALAGFLHPVSGTVLANQQPLDAYTETSIRSRIGYLEQNPTILAGTVRANLMLAKTNATDDELIGVLTRVGLWDMLAARQGLETELGDRGVAISGGEAQRLALARALLADFQVLIFDEPTANLDDGIAQKLWQDLVAIAGDQPERICVFITHDHRVFDGDTTLKELKLG